MNSIVAQLMALLSEDPVIVWSVLGCSLLILEIVLVPGFLIAHAIAAFAMAALMGSKIFVISELEQLAIFAGLGVGLIYPCRRFLRKVSRQGPDINNY